MLHSQRIQPLPGARHAAMHHEILVRLRDQAGALITPDRFLPAIESTDLMPVLDKAIVAAALESARHFPPQDVLSINLSGKTICHPGIGDHIREQLLAAQVDPARICFEITETAAIPDEALALEAIEKIRAMGCAISLDDFGAGHHSFLFMRKVRPDFVKIDGAFVRGIFRDDGFDGAVVRSIIEVARRIGAEVIAEYVEDERTMAALVGMGAAYAQGGYIQLPQPVERLR